MYSERAARVRSKGFERVRMRDHGDMPLQHKTDVMSLFADEKDLLG